MLSRHGGGGSARAEVEPRPGRARPRPSPACDDAGLVLAYPPAGTMGLEIEVTEVGNGGRCIALRGRLDSLTAPILDERLEFVLRSATALLFDMAGLEYISSAGIRCIIRARKVIEGRGGRVAIVNPQPAVLKALEIVKAHPSDRVFPSQAELDAHLDARERQAR